MKKILLLLAITMSFIALHSQKLSIDGKIADFEKKPVENATVYLLKQKDSSIINYTATNREGKFSLKTDELQEPSVLRIDADKLISFSKTYEKIDQSFSLGEIELERNTITNIEEVKITASPVKIKKDTIEFNASAIKVRPDSKIEELLKQIPGVEISNEGKITVNGKDVDQVMINGKPFFDKDGKIALQNLPADIIKNIQFTTTKTKEEELSGKTAKSNNTTINFNIDEKKNKGLISRLTVGYGSDERYEGSLLLSYFKNDTKISLLASSNNINSQGFSNDEVFDSMGSGRNSWLMQGGSVVTSGGVTYYTQGGSNKGIQRSTTVGFNYNDKIGKDTSLDNFSLIHTDNNLQTRSKVSRTTLLPDFTLKTNSESNGENESKQYNFDTSVRIKLDSLTEVYLSPSFSRTKSFNFTNLRSSTLRDDVLLNESDSYSSNDSESNSFTPYIYFSRKFSKKGRSLNANISTTISESRKNNLNKSQTIFYQSTDPDDIRNQLSKNKDQQTSYRFNMGYSEPISDSVNVNLSLSYETRRNNNLRDVNDFNDITGDYSDYNMILSNSMNQKVNEITSELTLEVNKKKLNLWASAYLDISDMKVNSLFNGQQYDLQKNFVLPNYNLSVQYQFSNNKRLSLYHHARYTIPSAQQLTPYTDFSNPLIAFQGNPDLKNQWYNGTYLYFNNYNMVKNINYYMHLNFTYQNNDVTNYSYYDDSGKQFVTYANVSGNKSLNTGGGFSKTFKWKETNKFTVNPRFNLNYNYNKGFINGEQYTSNTYTLSPGLNLTYEIKDKLTIKPSYSIGYNTSDYTNYSIEKVQNTNQSLKLQVTNYLFKSNLVFGNDFEYNTSSNITPGFKRDFYFWNTSLGYSFFNKQLIAKVKVYDVLNQNQSVRRTISNSYFEDREDLILKRYVMFSLSMKLNKFAGKNSKPNN